jgi:hypothetical protein
VTCCQCLRCGPAGWSRCRSAKVVCDPLPWVMCGCVSAPYAPLHFVPTSALVWHLFNWVWAWLEVLSALVMHWEQVRHRMLRTHDTYATDFRTAFNTISHDAVLAAVTERHPQLFPLARWAYSRSAGLWVHGGPPGHELLVFYTSDPIEPLFFALGLQGPFKDIVRDFPEVRVVAYLDDVYIQGPHGQIAQAFKRLCNRCEAIGLVMATQKYEVWSLVNRTAAAELADTMGFIPTPMKHAARGWVLCRVPLGCTGV